MTKAAPRRRAEKRRRGRRTRTPVAAYAVATPTPRVTAPAGRPVPETVASVLPERPRTTAPRTGRRSRFAVFLAAFLWAVVAAAGLAGLAAAALDTGPELIGRVGAVVVATAYTWALAVRTGGRPVIFAGLALVVATGALVWDQPEVRTGAAVMTSSVAAVLGVMATVPARRFVQTVREVVVAVVVSAGGTVAALGFDPVVAVARFQYAVLACSLIGAVLLVYRLGAGLHGLGRRGVIVVLIGGVMLAATLLYAEMIRRYGTPELVSSIHDGVAWSRDNLGGYPRPIEALLGVPALVWGTHMRARRRQGWWVCAFGVAVTGPVACTLINPDIGVTEALVSVGFGAVVGLVIGFVIIRIDLLLTGSPAGADGRPLGPGRRAAREAEDASAVRPEPSRFRAVL